MAVICSVIETVGSSQLTVTQSVVTYVQSSRQKRVMFTVQLNDFLQVDKDVLDVLWWEDPIAVHPLVENGVQHLQLPQVGTLSVEQL